MSARTLDSASWKRWLDSPAFAWLTFVLVPPLGLVLLWRRRRVWLTGKILATLLFVPATILHLHVLFGLRVDFAGDMGLIVEFWKPGAHIARLERQRGHAAQRDIGPTSTRAATEPGSGETSAAAAWPGFRGPNRDGIVAAIKMGAWPARGLRELWREPVGEGHGSFAIARGRAYTIEQRRSQEVVACYDMDTGSEFWAFRYDAHFQEVLGGPGPRATPAYDRERVFALGALGHLHCLDAATGKLIWQTNVLNDAQTANAHWGMSGSPLIDGDLVIVTPGGRSKKSVLAYDRQTGRLVWTSGGDPAGYSSPTVGTLCGVRQLLVFSGSSISGHSLADGRQLWRYPWDTQQGINACQPIVLGDDRVFISAGYDHGSALLHLTFRENDFDVQTVWETKQLKVKFSSALLDDGFIYGLDEAILVCLDASTGRRRWKGGRYGYGQLLLVGDSLLILAESGEVVRVRATPERFEELGRFRALSDKTWNHPAIAEGKLLVRNSREMACFELPLTD